MDFSRLPDGRWHILDVNARRDEKSREFWGTRAVAPDPPDEPRARLQKAAVDACRALRVRDYGRVDLRLTETGEIYVIEVNASCYLEQSGESAQAAAAVGIDYVALVNHIAELALERHGRAAAVENGLKTHGGSGAAGAGRAPGPAGP